MASSKLSIFITNLGKAVGKGVNKILINFAQKGSVIINGSI